MTEAKHFNILVVDDNANNRFALRTLLLRLKDCLVVEAESGQEALLRTFEHSIHLVLLDVQMPGMDGYDTARHLGMIKRTKDIPVIFVTAVLKSEEFIRRGYALGAVDYLTKPIDDNLLLNRVDSYRKLRERELRLADALEQVRLREERLNYALEATQDGIWDWDPTADTMFISPHFEAMLDYPTGTMQRSSSGIVDTAYPDDRHKLHGMLLNLQNGATDHASLEYRACKKDGTWVWLLLRAKVVQKESTGRSLRVVAASADISQRIIADDALRRAKLDAEIANRAKSVFLANMSHELRTPLNAILGFARILEKDERLSIKQRTDLQTIAKSGHHLLALINDVLAISRIETVGLVTNKAVCDLRTLLNEVIKSTTAEAIAGNLVFNHVLSHNLPHYIFTDTDKLQQILLHLISNAIKYTNTGTITFRVFNHTDAQSEHLIFEVQDTGTGIEANDIEHIFQPFFQTAAGIKRGEGTGLGLAISYEYAKIIGGSISVKSTPGQGSLFWLSLPVKTINNQELLNTLNQQQNLECVADGTASIFTNVTSITSVHEFNLDSLPVELRRALSTAIEMLDMDEIANIINKIKKIDKNIATTVESMVTDFRFERLLALCCK